MNKQVLRILEIHITVLIISSIHINSLASIPVQFQFILIFNFSVPIHRVLASIPIQFIIDPNPDTKNSGKESGIHDINF